MNFVMTYDLKLEGQERKDCEERIEMVLESYKYTKQLTTFFVVHIESYNQWDQILAGLSAIAKEVSGKFYFIMSPPVSGGRYNGYMPKASWNDINSITALD